MRMGKIKDALSDFTALFFTLVVLDCPVDEIRVTSTSLDSTSFSKIYNDNS